MKQITKLMFVAAAMAALVSCAKEKELEPTVQEGIKVTIVASKPDVTKTVISADGKSVDWKAGDAVGFFKAGASSQIKSDDNGAVLDAEGRAAFTATIPASEEGEYYVYYPYSDKYQGLGSGVSDTKIAEEQHPTLNSFDPMADILVSEPFTISATGDYTTDPAQLRFRRLSAFLKIHFADLTTGSILSGQFTEAISIQDKTQGTDMTKKFAGRIGLVGEYAYTSGMWTTTVKYDPDTFEIPTCNAYVAIRPNNYGGRTYLLTAETQGYTISKEFTLPADFTLAAGQMQSIKLKLTDANIVEKSKVKVERVWGKYSTDAASWSDYLEDFAAGADRNVTMDDNYIYIAETNTSKRLWALNLVDGSKYKLLPTTTVAAEGTWYLACPRVMNLDGTPVLTVANMVMSGESYVNFYVYENGIDAEPTKVMLTGLSGRVGDTFTYWGANATNSSNGQGLTKGLLYFDSTGGDGVRIWKTQWQKGNLPTSLAVQSRYGFDNGNTCVGAFWTFPTEKDRGFWGGRDAIKSVLSTVDNTKDGYVNLWSATGNQLSYTKTTVIESGWYEKVPAYQFFTYNDRRYIAYAKQVSGNDGRIIILQGSSDADWVDILNAHNVVYQAAIQENAENQDDYNSSPKYSGNSGFDLCVRQIGDAIYIVADKQNVGLSLFKVTAL